MYICMFDIYILAMGVLAVFLLHVCVCVCVCVCVHACVRACVCVCCLLIYACSMFTTEFAAVLSVLLPLW